MATECGITGNTSELGHNLNPNAHPFTAPPIPTTSSTNTIERTQIENLIRQIIQEQLNQNTETALVDEEISDTANLGDLDKTPDIVKAIRDFDGNSTEYTAWRKSVDRIFQIYENLKGTAKYYGIISTIRNKIIGQANTALESYNTPLNWIAIKRCLNTHYADKRDISTLEYQMTTLMQGNTTVEAYYQKVYNTFSLILNNISGMGLDRTTEATLVSTYRDKALDTFIRGLNGDLPRILAIKEPKSLPEALYLCTKLANQHFRTNYANNNQRQTPPNIQPRSFTQQPNKYNTHNTKSFHPQLTHFGIRNQRPNYTPQPTFQTQWRNHQPPTTNYQIPPMQFQNHQSQPPTHTPYPPNYQLQPMKNNIQRQFTTQRPTEPKPQPPPEPMDVDRSIRSRQVNYTNRQATTQYTQQQPQHTQNFYTFNEDPQAYNTLEETNDTTYTEMIPDEYVNDYMQQAHEPNNNHLDISDIHFLG